MRIELAKLILVGTRITYQVTGDAGWYVLIVTLLKVAHIICMRAELTFSITNCSNRPQHFTRKKKL